jgi:hypothetical protein
MPRMQRIRVIRGQNSPRVASKFGYCTTLACQDVPPLQRRKGSLGPNHVAADKNVRAPAAPVPEGQLTLAQRFSVGYARPRGLVPKGRLRHARSTVPSGLGAPHPRSPTLKRWAILSHPFGMKRSWATTHRPKAANQRQLMHSPPHSLHRRSERRMYVPVNNACQDKDQRANGNPNKHDSKAVQAPSSADRPEDEG